VSTEPAASRRRFVFLLLLFAALPWSLCSIAAMLPTPAQMLGPYYPLQPDPAAGNDLATLDGRGRAHGTPLTIVGRVRDTAGRAQTGVLVEIWQTNAHGRYHHAHDDSPQPLDPDFRGYGRAVTGGEGDYRFRTVIPASYPGRTPHVHFRLSRGGRELLVTQMYLPGEGGRQNQRDGLFMSVDAAERSRLIGVAQAGAPGTLRFDIVVAP
jgi:protocatechuate 3,4-dioxygenase, beta subunit